MIRISIIVATLMLAAPTMAQSSSPPADLGKELDAAVAADWPKYDRDGKGHLTQEEFATWLTALRAEANGASEDPTKLRAWADASFVKADGDADKQVSPEEFTAFLRAKLKK